MKVIVVGEETSTQGLKSSSVIKVKVAVLRWPVMKVIAGEGLKSLPR
jgi:hypothetical protein